MVVRTARRSATSGRGKEAAAAEKQPAASAKRRVPAAPRASDNAGRYAAPLVRLGMTPSEVRSCAGQPECILFGNDEHVEWQFGRRGVDVAGGAVLYVTTLTFAAGRVIRVTERIAEVP